MGCVHSTPTPTGDVFLIPQSPLCPNYLSSSFNTKKQYEFVTPKNCWSLKGRDNNNDKKSTGVSIEGCNLTYEPLDDNRCIVKEKKNDSDDITVAVLITGVRQVTMYSFVPVVGANESHYKTDHHHQQQQQQQLQHDGRPIYEWAVAKRHYENGTVTSQYELKNTHSSDTSALVTGNCGKVFSSLRHLVLKSQRTMTVCATVQEETNLTSWECRTCPGIDPVMVACFVVSLDKIKEMFEEGVKNNYHDVMVQREFVVVA
jgi:hypothetical protein